MKFKGYLEYGNREVETEFDIDDDTVAVTRLNDWIAKVQRIAKIQTARKPERPTEKVEGAKPSSPQIGGAK